MTLEQGNSLEKLAKSGIDGKINSLVTQIEKDYKFKGDTLNDLFGFKLVKGKEDINSTTQELIDLIKKGLASGDIVSTNPNNEDDLNNTGIKLNDKEHNKAVTLANKIVEVRALTAEIQRGIDSLKAEIEKESQALSTKEMITSNLYSAENLERINNPKNAKDQILSLLAGLGEFGAIAGKVGYDLVKGLVLSLYHLLQMLRGKEKYDTNMKI